MGESADEDVLKGGEEFDEGFAVLGAQEEEECAGKKVGERASRRSAGSAGALAAAVGVVQCTPYSSVVGNLPVRLHYCTEHILLSMYRC